MKGLRKDAEGRYHIDLRWTDPRTGAERRHQEHLPIGTTGGAARLRAQAVLGDALAGRATKTKAGEVTRLSQAFDAYLEWVKTNRPKAYKQRRSIKKVWIDVVGDVPIDRLGPELLERYKSKRQAAETAPATINKGMMVVKHMCGLAARSEWGWIDRERAAVIREVGMLEEPPGRQRPIKPKERDAIFAAFKRTDARFARRVIAAALLTGCRLGEILAMRVDDVDLRGKVIDLSKTKQNRNHQVVITPALASLLKEAMAEPGSKKSGVVFVNRFGKAYTVDGFSKHFARVADRAKCPDVTFHDLRRHVGTTLINAGERLEVVSKLLGHSNVAVTQRSYAHLTTEATRAAAERLSKALPVLPPIVASGLPSAADRRSRKRTKDATDAHEGGLS